MRVPLRANDESEHHRLWQAFRAELLRFVRKRVDDKSVAEDIVHDVLIKAFSHRKELKDDTRLRSWLYQITRNTLIDHYRSHKPFEPLLEDAEERSEEGERMEEELAHCLRPLLRGLPDKYRETLLNSMEPGVTQRQIALREGLSISGAKSRMQRGRTMLREALLQCCQVEMNQRGEVLSYEAGKKCGC